MTATSFRALDVWPGRTDLLMGTASSDLWQINPTVEAASETAAAAVSSHAVVSLPTSGQSAVDSHAVGAYPDAASSEGLPASATVIGGRGGSLPEVMIQGHTGDVWGIVYHPKKPHILVTACESNHIFVWHAKRKQLMVRRAGSHVYHHLTQVVFNHSTSLVDDTCRLV